jgi:single-strand DNA-binding protein
VASYNHITLVGNLTRDPELRYAANGTAICKLGLATNHRYKDREESCFLDVTVFGTQGETVSQYLRKGSQCLVDGRLAQESWEGQDGQRHSKHVVIADRCVFLGSKPTANGQAPASRPQPREMTEPVRTGAPAGEVELPPGEEDDIKF